VEGNAKKEVMQQMHQRANHSDDDPGQGTDEHGETD
jgi:hypothetical protein